MAITKDDGKRALHAYVSDEIHDNWHNFAAEEGISVSALLEILGGELLTTSLDAERWDEKLERLVKLARVLDAKRRRRAGQRRAAPLMMGLLVPMVFTIAFTIAATADNILDRRTRKTQ